jgi:DegV family protein with EDD domain
MNPNLPDAFITGYERLAPWADLLDEINVFPVADGDTGRNLLVSLAPLRDVKQKHPDRITSDLYHSARGNSGNIAAQFLARFLCTDSFDALHPAAKTGLENARQAVSDPQPGTMLTVLEALVNQLASSDQWSDPDKAIRRIIDHIAMSVASTSKMLPEMKTAGVVDAGALGMFIFLEGFFNGLCRQVHNFRPIREIFSGMLTVASSFKQQPEQGYCVDFVVRTGGNTAHQVKQIITADDSAIVYTFPDHLKIHLHTRDTGAVKEKAQALGQVVNWKEDDLGEQTKAFYSPKVTTSIHIVSDAAGSLTRELARSLGITLLDSYIYISEKSQPETCINPSDLYAAMRGGEKVSTSQASLFERHQHYRHLLDEHQKVLYLCVGSAFTGNYQTAGNWKHQNDPKDNFTILDTQAASGKLSVIVIATARFAAQTEDPDDVIRFACAAMSKSEEYIFVDKLHYLAAGGRLSKTSAFFGDALHMKPVISPTAEGAKKVGMVRNREAQVRFTIERLSRRFQEDSKPLFLLEYSDNREWVMDLVKPELVQRFPQAEILLVPFSLTSGAHIGPGAWAVAYLPETDAPS